MGHVIYVCNFYTSSISQGRQKFNKSTLRKKHRRLT